MYKTRSVKFNVPAGESYQSDTISGFSGLHITDNPLLATQESASDILNVYLNLENTLSTRPRLEYDGILSKACDMMISTYKLDDNLYLYHYKLSNTIYLDINSHSVNLNSIDIGENKIRCFKKDDKIYILSSTGYYIIKNISDTAIPSYKLFNIINDDNTYVPTTAIVKNGVSVDNESLNLLSKYYNKKIFWNGEDSLSDYDSTAVSNINDYFKEYTLSETITVNTDTYAVITKSKKGTFLVTKNNTTFYLAHTDESSKSLKLTVLTGISSSNCLLSDNGNYLSEYIDSKSYKLWNLIDLNSLSSKTITLTNTLDSSYSVNDLVISDDGLKVFADISNVSQHKIAMWNYNSSTLVWEYTSINSEALFNNPSKLFYNNYDKYLIGITSFSDSFRVDYYNTSTLAYNESYTIDGLINTRNLQMNTNLSYGVYWQLDSITFKVILGKIDFINKKNYTFYTDISNRGNYPIRNISVLSNVCYISTSTAIYYIDLDSFDKLINISIDLEYDTSTYTYKTYISDKTFLYLIINANLNTIITSYKYEDSIEPQLTFKYESDVYNTTVFNITDYIRFYNNYWFLYQNKLYNTQNNNPTYIPEKNISIIGDDKYLTGFNLIGNNSLCVYKENKQFVITASDNDGVVLYYTTEMKTDKGNLPIGETILSSQNNYPLQFNNEGIYVLQIPENVNTTENSAISISDKINAKYLNETNKENILTHNHLYWTYIMFPQYDYTNIYILDSRNNGWYYWNLPIKVVGMWETLKTYDIVKNDSDEIIGIFDDDENWSFVYKDYFLDTNKELQYNEITYSKADIGEYDKKQYTETVFIDDKGDCYYFKTIDYFDYETSIGTQYFDLVCVGNNETESKVIPWKWESQILPLTYSKYTKGYSAVGYLKQLSQTGFMFVDSDKTDEYSLNYQYTIYRKFMTDRSVKALPSDTLNYIKSVIKRTRIPKFNFIKLTLTNTDSFKNKLNLVSIKFKYRLMEETVS